MHFEVIYKPLTFDWKSRSVGSFEIRVSPNWADLVSRKFSSKLGVWGIIINENKVKSVCFGTESRSRAGQGAVRQAMREIKGHSICRLGAKYLLVWIR